MKKSSIRLDQDLIRELNLYKYKFQMKSISAVIRRLFEISSKFQTADNLSAENKSTTHSFYSTSEQSGVSSNRGASKSKEKVK